MIDRIKIGCRWKESVIIFVLLIINFSFQKQEIDYQARRREKESIREMQSRIAAATCHASKGQAFTMHRQQSVVSWNDYISLKLCIDPIYIYVYKYIYKGFYCKKTRFFKKLNFFIVKLFVILYMSNNLKSSIFTFEKIEFFNY